jgi:hypothetical protein
MCAEEEDFVTHFGHNGIKSRKLMVLLDGMLSVEMPMPPDVILEFVRDIISQVEKA